MTTPKGVGRPGSVRVASLADTGSARLLFPHDDTFWYELVRSFGTGEYGVSLFAEVLAIANTIQERDFESWYGGFNAAADRVAHEAATRLQRGQKVSARDGFLRASSYYFSSEFFLHANPQTLGSRAPIAAALNAIRPRANYSTSRYWRWRFRTKERVFPVIFIDRPDRLACAQR